MSQITGGSYQQTPDVGGPRTRGTPSWLADLEAYLSSHCATPPSAGDRRAELVAGVRAAPLAPEPWLAFLSNEDSHYGNVTNPLPGRLGCNGDTGSAGGVSLYHLYFWATQLIPRSKHQHKEEYIRIWLGYAKQQWMRNQDDARDTFKTLKNQSIGDNCAYLYAEWASLEHAVGNISKALGILSKGLREKAQPISVLEKLKNEMQSGTFDLKNHTFTDTVVMRTVLADKAQNAAAAAAATTAAGHHTQDVSMAEADGGHVAGSSGARAGHLAGASGAAHAVPTSSRAVRPGTDQGHTVLSLHSTSSRSTASTVHESTVPLSTAHAGSYKSSTTERSSASGMEEDTISCSDGGGLQANGTGAAARVAAGAHAAGSSAAAQEGQAMAQQAPSSAQSGGNNTATLGIKRFGFKTRATRVGGASSSQEPAGGVADMPGEDGSSGRKRRAETSTTASAAARESSPKLAAAFVDGQLFKAPPARPPANTALNTSHGTHSSGTAHMQVASASVSAAGAAVAGGGAVAVPMQAGVSGSGRGSAEEREMEDSDDSVPLVSSKLAARLAVDKCTPVPARRGALGTESEDGHGGGSTPDLLREGPCSQDSTPELASGGSGAGAMPPTIMVQEAVVHARQQQHQRSAPDTVMAEAAPAPAAAPRRPYPEPVVPPPKFDGRPSGQPHAQEEREPLRPVLQPIAVGQAGPSQTAPPAKAAAPTEQQQQQQQQQAQPARAAAAMARQQQQQAQQQGQQQQQLPPQLKPREDAQTVYIRNVRYTKLECVGRGGSSKVFKVMAPNCKIYALKRIRLQGRDAEAASGFLDEITLLKRLRNKPNIIQLIDSQVFHAEGLIYMVQEYGEIDLARLLAKHEAARRTGGGVDEIDENFVRLYWQQMLQAVSIVHDLRIVHSDLKPANFLLVEGALKLIDFGIAKAIQNDTTSIARESQVGTLNYMSPEAILGGSNNILGGPPMKVGRPSDIWSLGCILYQMVYGRTPFAELQFIPKMHAICNPRHIIAFQACGSADAEDVMRRCLDRDPKTRISMQELLEHPFLHPNRRRAVAPAPSLPPSLSVEQLRALVSQVAQAGASGSADIEQLTQQLLSQLAAGGGQGGNAIAAGAAASVSSDALAPGGAHAAATAVAAVARAPAASARPGAPPPPPRHAPGASAPPAAAAVAAAAAAAAAQRRSAPSAAMEGQRAPGPASASSIAVAAAAAAAARAAAIAAGGGSRGPVSAAVAPAVREGGGARGADLGSIAQAAAAAAAKRSSKTSEAITALETRRSAPAAIRQSQQAAPSRSGSGASQNTGTRSGNAAGQSVAGRQLAAGEGGGLEAALRQGLARFRFDDDHTSGGTMATDLTAPHPFKG